MYIFVFENVSDSHIFIQWMTNDFHFLIIQLGVSHITLNMNALKSSVLVNI